MSLLKFFHKKRKEEKVASQEEKKDIIQEEKLSKEKAPAAASAKKAPRILESGKKKNPIAYKNIIKPLVTEKSATLASENTYIFVVRSSMNKIEIKKAIHDMYGVKPKHVRIIHVLGKKVRYGRSRGRTKDWKKALVCLNEGEKIEVYEGV